jgi:hypothetical protein
MALFQSIDAAGDGAVADAFTALLAEAQDRGLLGAPWSLAELGLDAVDYQWLCEWAAGLDYETAAGWLGGNSGATEGADTGYVVMGLLFLLTAAAVARHEAEEANLWEHIERAFTGTARRCLFSQGNPSEVCKYAVRLAANQLNLRHVFGQPDVQAWRDCVFLQIGFTLRGLRNGLARWLVGLGRPVAVDLLLAGELQSRSFQLLWHTLREYRFRNIPEETFRRRVQESPWVLPSWVEELATAAREHPEFDYAASDVEEIEYSFLSPPRLHWRPPDPPVWRLGVQDLAFYPLHADIYDIVVNGTRSGRLLRQADASYELAEGHEIRAALAPTIDAELTGASGEVVAAISLTGWELSEDIAAFRLPEGTGIDAWNDRMQPRTAYALVVASDVSLAHCSGPSSAIPEHGVKVHYLAEGWDPLLCATLEGEQLWTPLLSGRRPSLPTWATQIALQPSCHEGVVELEISHPPGVAIASLRVNHVPAELLEPAGRMRTVAQCRLPSEALLHSLGIALHALRGGQAVTRRVRLESPFVGALGRSPDGWRPLGADSVVTTEMLRAMPLVVRCGPDANSGSMWLAEGAYPIRRVGSREMVLRDLTGLGAPLVVRKGLYNVLAAELVIASKVLQRGIVTSYRVSDGAVRVSLSHDVRPDGDYCIVRCRSDWSLTCLPIEHASPPGAAEPWWETSLGADMHDMAAVGIAYRGNWIGGEALTNWDSLLPVTPSDLGLAAAAALRWCRLPLLDTSRAKRVQRFVATHSLAVLRAWLDGEALPAGLTYSGALDPWLSAVREITWSWQPTRADSLELLGPGDAASPRSALSISPLILSLADVNPVLLARLLRVQPDAAHATAFLTARSGQSRVTPQMLRGLRETWLAECVGIMAVNEAFIRNGLLQPARSAVTGVPLDPMQESNLKLAMVVEPFRLLLLVSLLEDIAS